MLRFLQMILDYKTRRSAAHTEAQSVMAWAEMEKGRALPIDHKLRLDWQPRWLAQPSDADRLLAVEHHQIAA